MSSTPKSAVSMAVDIGSVRLRNPILVASGTFGYGAEFADLIDLSKLGGIVVKGLSSHIEVGNETPRIAETTSGMLNSIGLQNVGVEAFLEEKLPPLRQQGVTVIANIWGRSIEEYVGVAARLDGAAGLTALELNISCPNIKEGGINFGTDPVLTERVTAAVRSTSSLPLWVKLSPNVTEIGELALAAEAGGADALSVINTMRGMTVDVSTRRPTLASTFGGLSGPAIFPIALYMVHQVRRVTSLPIFGIGGIDSLDRVLQFLIVGANAVQVGTANFYDPTLSARLIDELAEWCEKAGLSDVNELVGTLRVT
jgi:dihydroorotate dehydrogenase (NAD+) catalytic subunit